MKKAFSLIELLISLIVISLIIAAFTPVLSKKLKHREIALSSGRKIETKCSEKFNEKCMICSNTECILCTNSFSCPLGQYCDEADDCKCKNCISKFPYCVKCTKNYCEECSTGYKINSSGVCVKIVCALGYYLSGSTCLPCPYPCKTCTSATNCTGCLSGFTPNGNSCEANTQEDTNNDKTNAACYEVTASKICIAKFNAGDPGGLEIPDGLVTMKTTVASGATGGIHSREICWRGENNGAAIRLMAAIQVHCV